MAALRIAGEPTELGVQHGAARRARIHEFLDDDLCRLNRLLPAPTDRIALRDTIDRHGELINEQLPRTFDEICGLAVGAGIELRDAILLQLRREVAGYTAWPLPGGDCTTLCRFEPGDPVLAQTIDLNGDLDDHMEVIAIEHAGGRRVQLVTFTGLLGYLGINSDGLAIGINLVLGGTWAPGVPPYLALRHLLDECSDVESCVDRLRELRLASSRALTLCDRQQAAWVELVDGRMAVARDRTLAHTNHFLAPELTGYEGINPFALASSKRRLLAGRAAVADLDPDPETIMSVLARPPIRVAGNGDIRYERTVGAVVLRPAVGELRVRRGDPALAPTEVFHIDDHARYV
jgi:hypothetical protein